MPVQMGADHLVEDARVDDHAHHREHRGNGRGDPGAVGARDVTIDHQDRREGVDGRDGAEHDKGGAGHSPEPLPIRTQRGAEHLPNPQAAARLLGNDHFGQRSSFLPRHVAPAGAISATQSFHSAGHAADSGRRPWAQYASSGPLYANSA